MKLHLVDGTFELFRAFYGAPSVRSSAGIEVAATRSLMRSLLALLAEPDVTHVAVAFDTVITSFRNTLFAGYKTGAGIDPPLLAQFPLAERAALALGLVVWPMVEFEADDAIATAAARWGQDATQTVICSPDKDFGQCVRGTRVVQRDRMREQIRDAEGIQSKFGVNPGSIPDWLALVGDSADGIPGIPKWGPKSAGSLLAHYHHVDAIPERAADWSVKVRGAEALASTLQAHQHEVLLYRQLATLRTDVPLPQSLEDLRWTGALRSELTALCAELGDTRLAERVPRWRS